MNRMAERPAALSSASTPLSLSSNSPGKLAPGGGGVEGDCMHVYGTCYVNNNKGLNGVLRRVPEQCGSLDCNVGSTAATATAVCM